MYVTVYSLIVDNDGNKGYYDFVGVILPIGYDAKNLLFFNKEDINSVIFLGYVDIEFQNFLREAKTFEESTKLNKLKAKKLRGDQHEL